jgi:hypothetical protein
MVAGNPGRRALRTTAAAERHYLPASDSHMVPDGAG